MRACKRALWMGLAVLGLAVLPGWSLAQSNDLEKAQRELEKARREADKAQQEAQQAAEKALRQTLLWQINALGNNRLGAMLESPSAAVAAQLDLPRGQGQVVKSVQPNSAAAKAGIQPNDILLEVDGKPVASNMQEFQKVLDAVKAETGVEAIVLRKGQKMTLKGLTLAKADPFGNNGFGQLQLSNGGFGFAMPAPQVPGQLVPTEVQGQLKLTAEQKEKLARLQKDTEAKFMELLTDEQKKRLEEMKRGQQTTNRFAQVPSREVWLGVQLDTEAENCTILDVVPDSPAEKAGLKANDVVLKFDGQKVESSDELPGLVLKKKAGDQVMIEVKRGNETLKLKATLAKPGQQLKAEEPQKRQPKANDAPKREDEPRKEQPSKPQGQNPKQAPVQVADAQDVVVRFTTVRVSGVNRLGATLETPSDTVANQLNLPQGQGLVLKNIPANSPAAKAGFQPNDILLELGGKTISRSPADFDKSVEPIKPDTAVDAVVLRKGERTTIKGVALAAAAAPGQGWQMMRAGNPLPKVPGDIFPAELQGQLKLTAEQKEKLARLQKDTEAKFMALLTDEQKKQLDELKKNQAPVQLKLLIEGFFEEEIELIPPKK